MEQNRYTERPQSIAAVVVNVPKGTRAFSNFNNNPPLNQDSTPCSATILIETSKNIYSYSYCLFHMGKVTSLCILKRTKSASIPIVEPMRPASKEQYSFLVGV